MEFKNTYELLNQFGRYVVQQSRSNLTRQKKNVSNKLYESISFTPYVDDKKVNIIFNMEDYAEFQDKGVKGVKGGKSLANYRYTRLSNLVGLEKATGIFSAWAKAKGIQRRDKKGRFLSYKQSGYAIANIVKNYGIKPSMFFTKPFNKALKDFEDRIIEAYATDIEESLQTQK
jgi:hypothetical protein